MLYIYYACYLANTSDLNMDVLYKHPQIPARPRPASSSIAAEEMAPSAQCLHNPPGNALKWVPCLAKKAENGWMG